MKHTKGPWRITLHKSMATLEKDCMLDVELPIATIEFHRGKEMDEANSHLIAAAPELLEVLKDLMAMRDECFIPNEDNWWDKKARQAIAKAEGK